MLTRERLPAAAAGGALALAGAGCLLAGAGAGPPGAGWMLALLAALVGGLFTAVADGRRGDAVFAGVIGRAVANERAAWGLRAAVVLSAPLAGAGVIAYAAATMAQALLAAPSPAPEADWRRTAGVGFLGLAVVLVAVAAGLAPVSGTELWSALLLGSGLALFWGTAGTRPDRFDPHAGVSPPLRTGLAIVLAVAGAVLLAGATLHVHHAGAAVGLTAGVLASLLLVGGPWWLRTRRLLSTERDARTRAQERAEIADHLHDSVLQTLALIQRRSADPEVVAGLAHRQERDLRDWLLGRRPALDAASLDAALRAIVAEVEDTHGAVIELVIVGDATVDEPLRGMLAATREALVNAARHAPGAATSVFARVEPDRISVYIRDRGPGFDPGAVAPGRRGVSDSIIGRMGRLGGEAEIRTAPGRGCEVVLVLERR